MSNAVYKPSANYSYKEEDARVIDTNQIMASRLEVLAEIMEKQKAKMDRESAKEASEDGFTALDASQVERLFGDGSVVPSEDGEYIPAEGDESALLPEASFASQLETANEEAEQIIEDAKAEALQILEDAKAEASQIRAEAEREGQRIGYDTGREEGLLSVEDMKRELLEEKAALDASYEQKIAELEPEFIDKLTDIYEHIFHVDLSSRKELVLYLLEDAMRKVPGTDGYLIHVSPDDFDFVVQSKAELSNGLVGTVDIINDIALKKGECSIETEGGIFDCSLDTQLDALKRELRLLSYNND